MWAKSQKYWQDKNWLYTTLGEGGIFPLGQALRQHILCQAQRRSARLPGCTGCDRFFPNRRKEKSRTQSKGRVLLFLRLERIFFHHRINISSHPVLKIFLQFQIAVPFFLRIGAVPAFYISHPLFNIQHAFCSCQ